MVPRVSGLLAFSCHCQFPALIPSLPAVFPPLAFADVQWSYHQGPFPLARGALSSLTYTFLLSYPPSALLPTAPQESGSAGARPVPPLQGTSAGCAHPRLSVPP